MALNLTDRILTIVVTATLTSAVWIVAGGSLVQYAGTGDEETQKKARPADAAPSPAATTDEGGEMAAAALDTRQASQPTGAEAQNLLVPVLNVRPADLTDTFSDSRGTGRLHEAIDIMAPKGTTVIAAAPGTIEKLFRSDAGGLTIYVRSADRETIHYYAHLSEYAPGLKEGQRVRRGQRLGAVGSTGNASEEAPHLHFAILRTTSDAEWWEPANAVNPYPLLRGRRSPG